MNEEKDKINHNNNNLDNLNPTPIKITIQNPKNIAINSEEKKEIKQTFVHSTNYILSKEEKKIAVNNRNYTLFDEQKSKKYKKELNFFADINISDYGSPINESINRDNINNRNINNNKNDVNLSKSYSEKTINSKLKFQEFYINDNIKNKEFKYKNNTISTTKYNVLTFIPKSLLIQFARLPNVYFLATAIIQSIPLISPLSSVTAIFPLIFVLSISMIRDLIEDLSRLTYDRINNNEEIIVFRDGKFIKSISSKLNIGELIIVNENKQIPCDLILIDSNLNDGMAYVETSSLDGEKNLKPKISNNNLCGVFKNLLNSSNDENPFNTNVFYNMKFIGFCQCDNPNSDLNKLDGRVSISYNINNCYIKDNVKFPINERQMLLKGSILRNTNWIIGFALYTGMNNKIILNSKKPRTKMSLIEKKMNKYLIGIFILLIILCFISSLIHAKNYKEKKKYYELFILLQRSHKLESFITFFTYFLLLNTLIPISLIITMEIVKMIQGLFISWDIELYSKIRNKFAKAKTVSINEELGNVNYIFSDKTGTLTANKMEFKYCIIYGKCYEYDKKLKNDNLNLINEIYNNKNNEKIKSKKKYPVIKIPKNFFSEILKQKENENLSESISESNSNENNNNNNKYINEEFETINEFWTAISLAHECICTKKNKYSAISPDDIELVKSAKEQGYTFLQSSNEFRVIRINKTIHTFTVLNILNFSSERKRMSIIIRDKNGLIKLYIKGADCEITKRMSRNSKNKLYSNFTTKSVDKLSCEGYRSLLIGYKIINEDDYNNWNKNLKSCEMNLAKRAKLIEKCYDKIEQDIELLGATIVEDKLQDKVPETIKDLRMAGIKIWVLTGDKINTAENISLSCNLISRNQKIFKIFISPNNIERARKDVSPEVNKFFNEFYLFEKQNRKSNIYPNTINFKNSSNNQLNINSSNNNINEGSVMSFIPSLNASILLGNNKINASSSLNSSKNIFSKYTLTREGKSLPPFSILIESSILSLIFSSEIKKNQFLKIALKASTVVCCRVSPLQKSKVVKEVKKYDKNAITLAIGDGGNDVSMIMEAHLGIGIYGEEGMRAVQASDFAIGEFKFLRRLLFFHGRTNSNRISRMILYFFYKNFVFSVVQFVYAFFCMGSGQTIIDDWFITLYNLVFTALPLGVQAITDFDILESDNDIISKFMPFLYKESREIYPIFSIFKFITSLTKGFISAFLIFYIVCFSDLGSEINKRGDYGTLWYMSFKTYTSIIISVNMTLFLSVRYITFLFPLIMILSSFILYFIFLVFVNYMTMFNSCAVIFHSLSCPKIYLSIFLVSTMSFLTDYFIESVNMNFKPNLSTHLLRKIMNKDDDSTYMEQFLENRKKCSSIFQINNLQNKAISKISFFSSNKSDKHLEIDNTGDNSIIKKNKNTSYLNDKEHNKKNRVIFHERNSLNDKSQYHLFNSMENWIKPKLIELNNYKKKDDHSYQLNS